MGAMAHAAFLQDILKKNNELIVEVQTTQKDAIENQEQAENKNRLIKCAQLIKEINENLTEVRRR